MVLEGWEVRLFGGRKFQYFVTPGYWHVQLWHPEARISVLTPSRLTCGFFEVYPFDEWKAQAHDYEALAALVATAAGLGGPAFPSWPRLRTILRAFVDDVVDGATLLPS